MKYATAQAFRAALEQRLRNAARDQGVPISRLRKMVIFDRLLARLIVVAPDRWMLKGALALNFRLGNRARTTMDIDLVRQDNEAEATNDLLAAQGIDLDDFFTFVIQRTNRLDDLIDGTAVRYHLTASLAGRRFDDAILDIGFGSPQLWQPELVASPSLLTFAGIEPNAIPTLPIEQHVAEKVHAYSRQYESGGSTRPKDLVDLILIQAAMAPSAKRLAEALEATFVFRGTHPLPETFPTPPETWAAPYRKMALEVGIEPSLEPGYHSAATFIDPILLGIVPKSAYWEPDAALWR